MSKSKDRAKRAVRRATTPVDAKMDANSGLKIMTPEEAKALGIDTRTFCGKEGCGVEIVPPRTVCDRHELAVRAVVARYLSPDAWPDAFRDLVRGSREAGLRVDWMEAIADETDIVHPTGFVCSVCGRGLTVVDDASDGALIYQHVCDKALFDTDREGKEVVAGG